MKFRHTLIELRKTSKFLNFVKETQVSYGLERTPHDVLLLKNGELFQEVVYVDKEVDLLEGLRESYNV